MNMKLNEIDKVEVMCLVDDHVNLLLPNTLIAHRPPLRESWYEKPPIGVHGFSVAVTVEINSIKHRVLFDAGLSPWAASYNVDALDFDLSYCEMVILSHGHVDHAGGLLDIRKKMNASSIPLIVHKDIFKNRIFKFQNSTINLLRGLRLSAGSMVGPSKGGRGRTVLNLASSSIPVASTPPRRDIVIASFPSSHHSGLDAGWLFQVGGIPCDCPPLPPLLAKHWYLHKSQVAVI